jgi:hypothetical protein
VKKVNSPLFELARLLVRFYHVATFIVNANHSIMRATEELCVADYVRDRVRIAVPQSAKWQRVGD